MRGDFCVKKNRMIAGVCRGIAEYFDVDSTLEGY
jgi:phage shock protein PspC (stress-responsive transcriptional regulator)